MERKLLKGLVSGRLTVLEEIDESVTYSSNPFVKCQCECGNIHLVRLENIRNKKTKSCGCLHREQLKRFSGENSYKYIDKTGKTFGDWTVVERVIGAPTGKGVYWKCRCSCGNEMISRHVFNSPKCNICHNKEKTKQQSYITVQGYKMILSAPNHPRINKNGYVLEHIVVMEEMIGRYLLRKETVHHINGVRDDNRPENLELWDGNHPPGQRNSQKMQFYMEELKTKCNPADLVKFCELILEKNK